MVRKSVLAVTGAALLFIIAGCGSGGSSEAPAPASSAPAYDEGYDSEATNTTEELPDNAAANRMIIKNAYMEIESDDSITLYNSIIDHTKKLGGYESGYNIDKYETYSVINADIRIPSDKFDDLTGYITQNSNVINNRMSTEDITEDYFDVKLRLDTKRATLQTYYNLLENASSLEEIIQLQRTIDEITLDIETMEGRLRYWNSQVSMSTVSMLIRQHNDPVKIRKDIDWNALSMADMGYLIKSGFVSTLDNIVVISQWLIIAALSLSPLLAIIAAVYFILKKFGIKLRPAGIKERIKIKKKVKGAKTDAGAENETKNP